MKVLAENGIGDADGAAPRKPKKRDPKRRGAEGDKGGKNERPEPRRALGDAGMAGTRREIVSAKDADQDQDRKEDPQPQPERQPIAVTLAQLPEPVVLERNVHRRLEAYDGENCRGDVGESR